MNIDFELSGSGNTNPATSLGGVASGHDILKPDVKNNSGYTAIGLAGNLISGVVVDSAFENSDGAGALHYQKAAGLQWAKSRVTLTNSAGTTTVTDFGFIYYLYETYDAVRSWAGGVWFSGTPSCIDILQQFADNANAFVDDSVSASADTPVGDANSAYVDVYALHDTYPTRSMFTKAGSPGTVSFNGNAAQGFTATAEIQNQAVPAHDKQLAWQAPGDTIGDYVEFTADGSATLESTTVGALDISVEYSALPATDSTATAYIETPLNELFPNVSPSAQENGAVYYRCIYIRNSTGASRALKVFLPSEIFVAGNVACGFDPSGAGGTAQTIADENTAPTGVTFSTPTTAETGLSVTLDDAEAQAVWLRVTVSAGTAEAQRCYVNLAVDY